MKAVLKTLDVLNIFLVSGEKLSLDELTELCGFNKSTVNRIVSILVKYGYLRQPEKRGAYSLGFKYFDFTGLIKGRMKIRDIASPFLYKLSQLLNESVVLAVYNGRDAIVTETFHSNNPLRVIPDEGTELSLHATSLGKIILASMTDEKIDQYYEGKSLTRYTDSTITNLYELKKYLQKVRQEGFAIEKDERLPNVTSLSAGLKNRDKDSIVGSIGIIGPTVRLTDERINKFIVPLKTCALKISKEMGYQEE